MPHAASHPLPAGRAARSLASPVTAVLIGWALATAITAYHTVPGLVARGPADTDVLTRLAEVRDLLDGQSWFDLAQRRFGPPGAAEMHWSRLIDAPIAGLVLLFSAGMPRAAAELAAMAVWPALLGLAFTAATVWTAVRLAGREAAWPAALMALFALHLRYLFSAGNLDHHNAQTVLSLVCIGALIRLDEGWRPGALAGAASALMLAIGLETLPVLGLAGAAAALALAVAPGRHAAGVRGFGTAFSLGALAAWLFATPWRGPSAPVCDVLSMPYLAAALVGGGGLAALAASGAFARAGLTARLAGAMAVGVAAAGAGLLIAPQCAAGPLAEVDPELIRRWLAFVDEAQPWTALLGDAPARAVSMIGSPLAGLAITAAMLWRARPRDRLAWAVLLGASALAFAVMLVQIRFAVLANAVALPAGAALIAAVRARFGGRTAAAAQVAVLAAWVLPQSILYEALGRGVVAAGILRDGSVPVRLPERGDGMAGGAADDAACFDRASFGALAALPPGRVLAPSNLGPAILAYTPHAALAGPYHREGRAILDSIDAFDGTEADARRVVAARGLDLVALCVDDSPVAAAVLRRPDGFAAALVRGPAPAWVEPVSTQGAIRVFRVRLP